jgi:hypothetical protein
MIAKASTMMRTGATAEERPLGAKQMRALQLNPNIQKLGAAGRIPWMEGAGRALMGAGAILSAWSGYETAQDNGDSVAWSIGVAEAAVNTGTSLAFTEVGASWGAAIDTAIAPGVGTLVGVGALVGAAASMVANGYLDNLISSIPSIF